MCLFSYIDIFTKNDIIVYNKIKPPILTTAYSLQDFSYLSTKYDYRSKSCKTIWAVYDKQKPKTKHNQ